MLIASYRTFASACPCVSDSDGAVTGTPPGADLFVASSVSAQITAVIHDTFPYDHISIIAARACLFPFLFDAAAVFGRYCLGRMKHQCLRLVAAFLLYPGLLVLYGPLLPERHGLCLRT